MIEKVIIVGAAGRDFHNFNVYFRGNPRYRVIAFTAAQIPNIEGRVYPPELAGELYPEGIPIYPEREMAELIREAALEGVHDELPHSLAVVIDEVNPREGRDDLIDVHAVLYVERDSQKGIVIGKGGGMLRAIGQGARRRMEGLLGTRVYLELTVAVLENWSRNPRRLQELGYPEE